MDVVVDKNKIGLCIQFDEPRPVLAPFAYENHHNRLSDSNGANMEHVRYFLLSHIHGYVTWVLANTDDL